MANTEASAGECVHTWANGAGVWHATVTLATPGYNVDQWQQNRGRVRARARRAIRREILARGEARPGWVCRLIGPLATSADGLYKTMTYWEA